MIAQMLFRRPTEQAATKWNTGHPRDPVVAQWMGGSNTTGGVPVDQDSALTYSAVWAATSLLSSTAACLPLNLMRKMPGNRKEPAEDHNVHKLLHYEPKKYHRALTFRQVRLIHQINRGNGYAEIIREDGGRPYSLDPIHPTKVTIDDSGNYGDSPYAYLVSGKTAGSTQKVILPEDMFHVRGRVSDDDILGKGIITQARESVGFGLATERHGSSYFGNGARPNVVVTHPGRLSEEARKNFRREWKELHGGPDKAGELALLQEGAKVELMNVSNEDSQFLESRQFNVQEIARWYNVPPHMIGDLSRATFSNIESQGIDFVTYSLNPWLCEWESEIYCKLLSEKEKETYYAKHNVNALLRGDSAARAAFYQALWNIGVFSDNDIRALEDMNPIPEGDRHFVPLNTTTLEAIAKGEQEQPLVMETEQQAMPMDDEEEDDVDADEDATPLDDDEEAKASAARIAELEAKVNHHERWAVLNLEDVAALMLRKECEAIIRAAEKPGVFIDKCEDFYRDHAARITAAIRIPVATLMTQLAEPEATEQVAERMALDHCHESMADVLRAAECKPSELKNNVLSMTSRWGKRKLSIPRA